MAALYAACGVASGSLISFAQFDAGLAGSEDPDVLEWAAQEDRVVVSHDVNTMPAFAYERVRAGQSMPGVFIVPTSMAIGQAIDELEFAVEAMPAEECRDQVIYFPL
ncbi:MAG: DUF5615 family PIN-like protein [Pirellulales bacterium]